jgi:hypothetical protein
VGDSLGGDSNITPNVARTCENTLQLQYGIKYCWDTAGDNEIIRLQWSENSRLWEITNTWCGGVAHGLERVAGTGNPTVCSAIQSDLGNSEGELLETKLYWRPRQASGLESLDCPLSESQRERANLYEGCFGRCIITSESKFTNQRGEQYILLETSARFGKFSTRSCYGVRGFNSNRLRNQDLLCMNGDYSWHDVCHSFAGEVVDVRTAVFDFDGNNRALVLGIGGNAPFYAIRTQLTNIGCIAPSANVTNKQNCQGRCINTIQDTNIWGTVT